MTLVLIYTHVDQEQHTSFTPPQIANFQYNTQMQAGKKRSRDQGAEHFTPEELQQLMALHDAITRLHGQAFTLVQTLQAPVRHWVDCLVRATAPEPSDTNYEVTRVFYSKCARSTAQRMPVWSARDWVLCRVEASSPPLLLLDERASSASDIKPILRRAKGVASLPARGDKSLGDLMITDPDFTSALSHAMLAHPPNMDSYALLIPAAHAETLMQQPDSVTLSLGDMRLISQCKDFWSIDLKAWARNSY